MVKDELHSIASALVGGARYGAKVRLPHALVMTFLFRKDLSTKGKLRAILSLGFQHASSLAAFATLYKFILALLKLSHRKLMEWNDSSGLSLSQEAVWKTVGRNILLAIVDGPLPGERRLVNATTLGGAPPGHPERMHHAFIAGGIGGYFVWGRYSSLNHQIILYLTSRVLAGLWTRLRQHHNSKNGTAMTNLRQQSNNNNRSFSWFAALIWAIVMALWEESPDALHPSLKKSMDEIYRYCLPPPLKYDEVEPSHETRIVDE